jgi:hypothetical protein
VVDDLAPGSDPLAHMVADGASLRLFLKIEVERSQADAMLYIAWHSASPCWWRYRPGVQFNPEHRVSIIVYGLGLAVTFSVVFLALIYELRLSVP